jgi:hypothetical protein
MELPIIDFLEKNKNLKKIRLHMPGHKGNGGVFGVDINNIHAYDITEIDGADCLYNAICEDEGNDIIFQSERNASRLFRTFDTYYSAGGSTLCIQTMLAVFRELPFVAVRNVHVAFVNACGLLGIDPVWVMPEYTSEIGGEISPESIETALKEIAKKRNAEHKKHPEKIFPTVYGFNYAVYLTSPDYTGKIADISGISAVCKKHNAVLLVDNAHGSHLAFLGEFLGDFSPNLSPENPLNLTEFGLNDLPDLCANKNPNCLKKSRLGANISPNCSNKNPDFCLNKSLDSLNVSRLGLNTSPDNLNKSRSGANKNPDSLNRSRLGANISPNCSNKSPDFCLNSAHPIHLGADFCCDSAHKMLPVLTGGAYLHVAEGFDKKILKNMKRDGVFGGQTSEDILYALREMVKKNMSIFGSSSPSYLILASLDGCNEYLEKQVYSDISATFELLVKLNETLIEETENKNYLAHDPYHVVVKNCNNIAEKLGEVCVPEYVCDEFIILLFSPRSRREDILTISEILKNHPKLQQKPFKIPLPEKVMSIREAMFGDAFDIRGVARMYDICTEVEFQCPPGVANLIPGEALCNE